MATGQTRKTAKAVTLRDVARQAGVSVSTASRAMTPGFTRISEETRRQVQAAIAGLGYEPDISARAISTGHTSLAAIVVSDIRDPFNTEIAQGFNREAVARGLVATIAGTGDQDDEIARVVRGLRGMQPAAIVLVEPRDRERPNSVVVTGELGAYAAYGGHLSFVGSATALGSHAALPWRAAGVALLRTLVDLGYRHPAAIAADVPSAAMMEWRAGLDEAAAAAGVWIDHRLVARTGMNRAGGYQAARDILESRGQGVDVIIGATDMMAVGVVAAIADAGLAPGADIGVAGCDDLVFVDDVVNPHLTSVNLNLADAGAQALRLALDSGATAATRAPAVVVRASTPRRG